MFMQVLIELTRRLKDRSSYVNTFFKVFSTHSQMSYSVGRSYLGIMPIMPPLAGLAIESIWKL
jgi:hypothetical protein